MHPLPDEHARHAVTAAPRPLPQHLHVRAYRRDGGVPSAGVTRGNQALTRNPGKAPCRPSGALLSLPLEPLVMLSSASAPAGPSRRVRAWPTAPEQIHVRGGAWIISRCTWT